MLNPFRIKSKLELKNTNSDTYKSTLQNDTLTADSTVTLPNFATNTLASVNNAQTFTAAQTFQAVADATLGAEIITNVADRDMSGANNWTGTNWTVTGGLYVHTAGANTATLAGYGATIGNTYLVTMTIATGVAGTLNIRYGTSANHVITCGAGSTLTAYSVVITATTTAGLSVIPSAAWTGSIDDVSIKQVSYSTAPIAIKNASAVTGIEERAPNSTSVAIGVDALKSAQSAAINNVAIGNGALKNATTGATCVGIGSNALTANTTGYENTAIGHNTLFSNTYGFNNVACGAYALQTNVTGQANTAIGRIALANNLSGSNNEAIGYGALGNNTTGTNNTSIGSSSSAAVTSGINNVVLGSSALCNNSTGNCNIAIGVSAARYLTGANNTAIGYSCLNYGAALSGCVTLGFYSGCYNTASNKLFIDNQNRTNEAGDLAGAIIQGTFSATPSSQTLVFNAACTSVYGHTTNTLILTGTKNTTINSGATDSDWTMTLPTTAGTNGYTLITNGSGVTSWASILSNPMTNAGEIIYGGTAGAATALAAGTSGYFLKSGGAGAPTWDVIQDASASVAGIVSTGTQTFAGAKTFGTSAANGLTSFGCNSLSQFVIGNDANSTYLVRNGTTYEGGTKLESKPSLRVQMACTTTDSALAIATSPDGTAGDAISWTNILSSATNGAWTIGPATGLTTEHLFRGSITSAGSNQFRFSKLGVAKNTANNYYISFTGSDGDDGYLFVNGSGVFTVGDDSDIRLKKNIVREPSYGLGTVMQLKPVEFDWIDGPEKVKGFIAQEVQEVLPESVGTGPAGWLTLEMQTMIPVMMRAIQELNAKVEALEAKLNG